MSNVAGNPSRSGRGGVSFLSQGDGSVVGKVLSDDHYARAYWREPFPTLPPRLSDTTVYGAPTGATGDQNLAQFAGMSASYHIKGAGQTILGPFVSAAGYVLAGLDQAAAEGVEYLLGQFATDANPFGMTVGGNRPSVFARLDFDTDVVANLAECAIGFRKAEPFQANLDDYDELACLNLQGGSFFTETILNGDPTVSVDTGLTLADDTRVVVEAFVGADGKPGFTVNGARVPLNFTFDNAEVLVPFIFWLQVTGGAAFRWYEGRAGRLWHERRDGSRRAAY